MLDTKTARTHLDAYELKAGDTLYTILRSVARSGMSRRLDVVVVRDGVPVKVTHLVAPVLGNAYSPDRGMKVDGAGMDMGFHVVYSLSRRLFDDGYALNHRWL